MNKILELDRENLFMVVEPGVTTGEVQRTAQEAGYLYAGDPCSADSSYIGVMWRKMPAVTKPLSMGQPPVIYTA